MALTPFDEVPKFKFLVRMVAPAMVLFGIFFLSVGVFSNALEFQHSEVPATVLPFWSAASHHYEQLISTVGHVPEVCWAAFPFGTPPSDFQAKQCEDFWNSLLKSGGLAMLPFLTLLVFLILSWENLLSIYKKVQKKADLGKVILGGTVTQPPHAPGDLFSWFYCLRPIMIQLPDKKQMKVYVALDAVPPSPGQTLAVFEPLDSLGEKRHLAMIYAPHIAVIKGA